MRFRRQKRKRIGNVSGNVVGNALETFGGKTEKTDAKETFRKRCLANQPPKADEKQTLWKRSERFLAAQKKETQRKRNGNAQSVSKGTETQRKRIENAWGVSKEYLGNSLCPKRLGWGRQG